MTSTFPPLFFASKMLCQTRNILLNLVDTDTDIVKSPSVKSLILFYGMAGNASALTDKRFTPDLSVCHRISLSLK